MSSLPPPPPGFPGIPPPPGMPPPPPGMPMPNNGSAQTVGLKISPEALTHKANKWVQMQNKRYGEKRKAGFVDVGKQVCNYYTLVFVALTQGNI